MGFRSWRCALPASIVLALMAGDLIPAPTARADTPAQTRQAIQTVVERATASYGRRDLFGFLAMFSPNFVVRSVGGRKETFRREQAGIASLFARNDYTAAAHCTVSQVVLQGDQARAIMHWHYVTHFSRSAAAPAYTVVRDYEDQATWKKLPGGWREVAADQTHDTTDSKR